MNCSEGSVSCSYELLSEITSLTQLQSLYSVEEDMWSGLILPVVCMQGLVGFGVLAMLGPEPTDKCTYAIRAESCDRPGAAGVLTLSISHDSRRDLGSHPDPCRQPLPSREYMYRVGTATP